MQLRGARWFATTVAVAAGALGIASVGPSAAAPGDDDGTPRCSSPYPASVATTVEVTLERPIALQGQRTRVAADVQRAGSGEAVSSGHVRIVVLAGDGSREVARTLRIEQGRALAVLPPRLPAEDTYTVQARYLPPRCSSLAADAARERHYTVFPRSALERGS